MKNLKKIVSLAMLAAAFLCVPPQIIATPPGNPGDETEEVEECTTEDEIGCLIEKLGDCIDDFFDRLGDLLRPGSR